MDFTGRGSARRLWRLSISTTPEAEEAVAALVEKLFGESPCAYTEVETGVTTVSVYFESSPEGLPARQAKLAQGLAQINACGLDLGPGQMAWTKMRQKDWAEAWKRHFRPLEIGSKLLIKPSWSRRRPRKGQAVVVLDPGLSFGTGQHPTTAFCLRQLVARLHVASGQSLLDVGTGSGILAIAAAKLGYRPIHALDLDPAAVRIARANVRTNAVDVQVRRADLARLPRSWKRKYSVVCANLVSNLLIENRDQIVASLEQGGLLVLAGILKIEFGEVQETYQAAGLRLATSQVEREWRSGAFEWPARRAPVSEICR